jgi:hypothetical protein
MKISIDTFCYKYDISYQSMMSMRSQNKYPEYIFHKVGRHLYVDESYFLKRWEFIRKVNLRNQDLYHLLAEHFSEAEMARAIKEYTKVKSALTSISAHLREDTFMLGDGTNQTIISPIKWAVYRYASAIERRLKRRGASIEKILDRRMYEA